MFSEVSGDATANVIRGTDTEISGRTVDKASRWWSKEVQEYMQRMRLAKEKWDNERTEERRRMCRDMQRKLKVEVAKAKQRVCDEFCVRSDRREGDTDLYRLSRQRDRDGNYMQQGAAEVEVGLHHRSEHHLVRCGDGQADR